MKKNTEKKNIQPLWESLFVLTLKIIYLIILTKKFKYIPALFIFFFSIYLYHKIISLLFGLTPLSGYDKVFITTNPSQRYQITSFSRYIKNFDPEKYRQFLKDRLVSKNPKYHSRLIKKFMEYYWYEDPDIEKAYNSIIKLSPRLNNFEEALEFVKKELNIRIDIFNDYPYELNIVPYGKNEGICIFKFDHLLTDGLGIVATLCLIADNFSEETYPKIIKLMREPNIFQKIYLYLVAPFYGLLYFIHFTLFKDRNCPFKANKKELDNDTIIVLSKKYKLKDFENFRKQNNVSFNDIMLASFSIAMNKIYKQNDEYKGVKDIVIDLPVGRKMPPNQLECLKVTNEASGIFCDIPLINSIDEIKKIKKQIRKNFKIEYLFSLGLFADIFCNIFDWNFLSRANKNFTKRLDFMFTNVPGPAHQLCYYGMDVNELYTFPLAGGGLPYICILSYNGYFQFIVNSNKNADCNIKLLLDEYEKALDLFII